MKISQGIARCVDPVPTRYSLNAVQVRPSEQPGSVYLTATDSHIAAVVRTPGSVDGPDLIPSDVLPTRKAGCEVTRENGHWTNSDGKTARPPEGRFPKVYQVLPEVTEDYQAIYLDVDKLKNLADALSPETKRMILYIPHRDGAIPVTGELGIGAIMPCCDEPAFQPYNKFRNEYEEASK